MARAPKTDADTADQPQDDAVTAEASQETQPLEDQPSAPDAVSAAPPRPHDGIVSQLTLRWAEFKNFVAELEGDVEGELGDVLLFVRSKL